MNPRVARAVSAFKGVPPRPLRGAHPLRAREDRGICRIARVRDDERRSAIPRLSSPPPPPRSSSGRHTHPGLNARGAGAVREARPSDTRSAGDPGQPCRPDETPSIRDAFRRMRFAAHFSPTVLNCTADRVVTDEMGRGDTMQDGYSGQRNLGR